MTHHHDIFAVIWRPVWPPLYIEAVAVMLGVLAVLVYSRTLRSKPILSTCLLVMRLGVIAAIVVLLMGPSEIPPQSTESIRPHLCIMLDTSESMLTPDCTGSSRMAFAQKNWLSAERLEALARDFDVDIQGFDTHVTPMASSSMQREDTALASGRGTQLAECVSQSLLKMPANSDGQAMLVISDGHDTTDQSIQSAATIAKARHIPVHTVCLGGSNQQRDIALLAIPMQEYMLAKEPGEIVIKVYQVGLDQQSTKVHVDCSSEHLTMPVQFNGRRVVEMKVPIKQDRAGQYEYSVRVDPLDGEVETNNNTQSVFCNVTSERIKVLLIEGQPYWDTKFLAQALRKDERVELTQITQVSGKPVKPIVTRAGAATSKMPQTAQELAKFDVVILGHEIEKVFSGPTMDLLNDFVSRQGGHIIFARGMSYDPSTAAGKKAAQQLADLEPVTWGRGMQRDMSLALTPSGKNSPWFSALKMGADVETALSRLPGFTVMPRGAQEKPATVVLMRARPEGSAPGNPDDGDPALVSMSYGRGTVVAVLGEGLWQWSLLEKQKRDLAGFYDSFWSNLVRWLAMGGDFQPGQQVSMKLARNSLYVGDPLTIDVVYRLPPGADAHPSISIADPSGQTTEVPLHRLPGQDPRFRATVNPSRAGVYRAILRSPGLKPEKQEHGFSVYDVSLERLETSANPLAMSVLSEHSGGETLRPDQADLLVDRLNRQRLAGIVPTEPEYVWDNGGILFLLLTWTGLEWIIRRKAGLL